ncbi:hypothetical protein P154DRAFT_522009 [Amniculicola lignicola CBS 123094]|uniref:Uncharacterized protein n=1 Tax=Amniculicola lignicola CBS 123094 TaxID=1392246 RepID=A0A6A5WGI0_9PLEO|nr:hypothetical protein P154DRAFT_522009 [Amniculicola lignicola CBS 123094]
MVGSGDVHFPFFPIAVFFCPLFFPRPCLPVRLNPCRYQIHFAIQSPSPPPYIHQPLTPSSHPRISSRNQYQQNPADAPAIKTLNPQSSYAPQDLRSRVTFACPERVGIAGTKKFT